MNATVTRSATRSAATKSASKAVAPRSKTSAARPAKKSILKTTASKLAKTIGNTLKPASKTSATATKAIAKSTQTTVKSTVKSVAKTIAGTARATDTKKTVSKAGKATAATDLKRPPQASASKVGSKETSGTSMSGNNAGAGLMDTMEKPVVSKVSEVATKTTKSTPAVPADGTLLTEEQILKMSDKDYMNEAQLAFFKARLQQLERDLLKNAGETTEHLRETVLVPDPADRATIEEEHALELRTRDRERKLLKKVQQSIASIDAGEYGWCEETGEPIGIPRLLARPTATLSLEAQQRRELKQKLYGD